VNDCRASPPGLQNAVVIWLAKCQAIQFASRVEMESPTHDLLTGLLLGENNGEKIG